MLKPLFATLILSMFVVMGCSKETDPAKTPGAKTTPAEESTFKLELPQTATNVAKGTDEPVTIGVDRGEDLKGEVALTFQTPEGITIKEAKIPADDNEVDVTVTAADTAGAGEQPVTVTGKVGGKETTGTFKVEVTDAE
jgi:uncharacterized membrane protein